jgi:solute carrier family 25 phosphate transporter 23/24/25/41
MDIPETQNSRDARIEELWKKLDPHNKGEIDVKGLQRGLKKIDHPLKNAHDMLEDVVKAMDKNGDQVIQYEGMCSISTQSVYQICWVPHPYLVFN